MAKTRRRFLLNDAAPGEEAALVYFLRDDQKIAAAWWFFCLWCADHKPAFTRQLEQLAARIGRPVTHVDGIRVALRFWELSRSADPAFADQWKLNRQRIPEPERDQWGELGRLIDRLAEQEGREFEPVTDDKERERLKLAMKILRQETGIDVDAWMDKVPLEQLAVLLDRFFVVCEIQDMACALSIWSAAAPDNRIMILAGHALPKPSAS